MAEEKKYLDAVGVKHLWDKAADLYQKQEAGKGLSSNDYTTAEKEKLAELENYELPPASQESLGGIIIGDGLSVDAEGKVHTVYNPEMGVDWDKIEDTPTTLDGYGITDAATKTDLDEVREEVSKVYHPKGSVPTYADLLLIEDPHEGDVYDVLENDKNYAWVQKQGTWTWDDIGGIFEIESISNYELDIITGSASSEAALKELLSKGGEVELGANIALTEAVAVTKNTVLDLSNFTLSSNVSGYALVADGAKLTLKNGKTNMAKRIAQAENGGEIIVESGEYISGDVAFSAIGEGSKVTFNDGTLVAVEGGIGSFDKGAIEVNGGYIKGTDNFALFTNGTDSRGGNTIVVNDGILEGNITSNGYESCSIYIANNDSFTMNGGKIVSNDGCGILMRAGNVIINNGEIIAKKAEVGSHSPGWVGDNKTKMSASAVIYHESANYPGKTGMSLTINGGQFVGVDHALEVLSNETTPNVTVTGGKFTPPYPEV